MMPESAAPAIAYEVAPTTAATQLDFESFSPGSTGERKAKLKNRAESRKVKRKLAISVSPATLWPFVGQPISFKIWQILR